MSQQEELSIDDKIKISREILDIFITRKIEYPEAIEILSTTLNIAALSFKIPKEAFIGFIVENAEFDYEHDEM
jgi:hypothetical protein